jgi:predicted RecA/RadA family phage recombinase
MAKNYIQPGKTITLTAPYQRNTGEGALVGSIFGVALATVANGASGEFATVGVWELAKTNAEAWSAGALIYWDDTNKETTTTATSNKLIGAAVAAAGNPSGTGKVRLNGAFTS